MSRSSQHEQEGARTILTKRKRQISEDVDEDDDQKYQQQNVEQQPIRDGAAQPDTEMQSFKDGANLNQPETLGDLQDINDQQLQHPVQENAPMNDQQQDVEQLGADDDVEMNQQGLTSFMGIMDFIQPDGEDDIFAAMGIARAAPVALPKEKVVVPKPTAPKAASPEKTAAPKQVEVIPEPVIAQETNSKVEQSPAKQASPVKAESSPIKEAKETTAVEEAKPEVISPEKAETITEAAVEDKVEEKVESPNKMLAENPISVKDSPAKVADNKDDQQVVQSQKVRYGDDSSSSSGMSSSDDDSDQGKKRKSSASQQAKGGEQSQERKALMSKLQRMKELLKQKKISQNQHKKEILKAAKEEQRRQEKERRKKEHLEKKALRASVPKPSVEKPAKKPKEPSEKKIVNKKPSVPKANIQKKVTTSAQNYTPVVNEEDIDYTNKLHCVDELANRWWYALPAWPPVDFDYNAALASNGLRAIDVDSFRNAPEFDPKTGHKKVYPLECYEGIYRDLQGNMYDLRPRETAPSLINFQKMQIDKLRALLSKAYAEQLAALKKVEAEKKQYDRQSEAQIKKSVEAKLSKLQRVM